jgi:hypothetical protein
MYGIAFGPAALKGALNLKLRVAQKMTLLL